MFKKMVMIVVVLGLSSCSVLNPKSDIPSTTPSIGIYSAGDNLYPETGWRIYATDQLEYYSEKHPPSYDFPEKSMLSDLPAGTYAQAMEIYGKYQAHLLNQPRQFDNGGCSHCGYRALRYFDGENDNYWTSFSFPSQENNTFWSDLQAELGALIKTPIEQADQ